MHRNSTGTQVAAAAAAAALLLPPPDFVPLVKAINMGRAYEGREYRWPRLRPPLPPLPTQ